MDTISKQIWNGENFPFHGTRAPRLLFVSDDTGERAWLAAEYARRIAAIPGTYDSAGVEVRAWGSRFLRALQRECFELPEEAPVRALDLAFAGARYDIVVTISETGRLGLGEIFRTYIQALFANESDVVSWEISSLGLSAASREEWEADFMEVATQLSAEVAWLLAGMEEALPGAA